MTKREMRELAIMIADEIENRRESADKLISVDQASKLTGLAIGTLYNRKDSIGYVKKGRKLYFSLKNIREYERSREHY